jgi:choline dehydrogenase-like flavoprotein
MDDFERLGQFGLMVRDGGDGWVRRGPDGRPIVGYRLSEASQRRLMQATSRVAEVFIAAGASEVYPGIARLPLVRTAAQARDLALARPRRMDFRLLGAHPLGTCAMGSSPDRAVVDFEHRVFGTDNLHIVDGSVIPTSLGVNPQMTIMAFALRAADVIAGLL